MADQTKKQDAGKARMSLVPRQPLLDIVACLEVGANKYATDAWRGGMEWTRVWDALDRHARAWLAGEEVDPQDGQLHLAAVAVNAMFLLEYKHTHPELDNRYKPTPAAPPVLDGSVCPITGKRCRCQDDHCYIGASYGELNDRNEP